MGCSIINALKECRTIQTEGGESGRRQPPMTEEKCLPEEATSEGRSPAAGERVSNMRCDDHYHYVMDTLALLYMMSPCSTLANCRLGWPRSIDLNCVTK